MRLIEKIISTIVPIVVLVILILYFYGGSGALVKLRESVNVIGPNISFGANELEGPTLIINKNHSRQLESLSSTVEKMINSSKDECFAKFEGFSDLRNKATKITLRYNLGDTDVIVRGGAGGKQSLIDEERTIIGMRPCVIAGLEDDEVIARNFFDKFMFKKYKQIATGPYTKSVSSIVFSSETGDNGFWRPCTNANALRVPQFGESPVNNQCNNMENEGWLFKTSKSDTVSFASICFFPTNRYKNADKDGIANEWFSQEDESIAKKVALNSDLLC